MVQGQGGQKWKYGTQLVVYYNFKKSDILYKNVGSGRVSGGWILCILLT